MTAASSDDAQPAQAPGPDDLVRIAIRLHQTGDLARAEILYRRALSLEPDNSDALHLLGLLLSRTDRGDEGLPLLDRAAMREPGNAIVHNNRGAALRDAGRLPDAQASYEAAIACDPDFAEAYYNLGNLLLTQGHTADAVTQYDRALAANPDYPDAHHNRGNALLHLRKFEEAVATFDRLIELRPELAKAHHGRGVALDRLDRHEEALGSHQQALRIKPDDPAVLKSRGNSLRQLGRNSEAVAAYSRELHVLRPDTERSVVVNELWRTLLEANSCALAYDSQNQLEAARTQIENAVGVAAKMLPQFPPSTDLPSAADRSLAFHLDGFAFAYHQHNDRQLLRDFSAVLSHLIGVPEHAPPLALNRSGRIRVGIAGQRLRDHNGANWALNWLQQLPADDYSFFTYAFEPATDAVAQGFARLGTHRTLGFAADSYQASLAAIRADNLDLLMLPEVGMTPASRVLSLHRLAPVQFTAWGHPVTTGSANMDFYLSSDLMEPPNGDAHYTEELVRLPNLALYLTPQMLPVGPAFELPQGRVLFGCLQSLFKYLPRDDELLPLVAAQVPDAMFVFFEGKPAYMTALVKRRLMRTFSAHGLDAERHLLFLPRVRPADYLRLQQQMDVIVDSVGWSGGNTSLSAIEMGVPLATLPGAFMRGRHTSAMLQAIGHPDLIANSLDDYVAKLVTLGRDRGLREEVGRTLRRDRERLYEDRQFAEAFDSFLKDHSRR